MTADAPAPARPGLLTLVSRGLSLLPAFVLAWLALRVAELGAGIEPGTSPAGIAGIALAALGSDGSALLRHLAFLLMGALPLLWLRSPRARGLGVFAAGALLLAMQAALLEYFLEARVPLGADLFGYSWQEITDTARAGAGWQPAVVFGLLVAWALWGWGLRRALAHEESRLPSPQATVLAFVASLVSAAWLPAQPLPTAALSEDARNLAAAKTAFFIDDSWRYWRQQRVPAVAAAGPVATAVPAGAGVASASAPIDPQYPFLREDRTPDALGPLFRIDPARKPNLVFIVVEGLGRSFSGPDARLGSFTPFLDELATRSLYFDNFLATQGRTFAVLPSLFASLPFGANGFNALGADMPAHASLPGLLKAQGWSLGFYAGFDADFDDERGFLALEGFDRLRDEASFAPGGRPFRNYWGYGDDALVQMALTDQAQRGTGPRLDLLQTISMHTPYTVPDQDKWRARFEQRLDELGVWEKASYRANRDIYATVLYTDDALRRYFEQARKLPGYEQTIFIVTGDHRLPEIPMATRIDRYHVPLLIYSPMLVAPRRIKAVSSDFDVAPSLLAFLAHGYGLRTPRQVTWLGDGLDLSPQFRNGHDIPLKQTKTNLVDFVSGLHFLNQDTLYALRDGMEIAPVDDPAAMAQLQARFAAFRAANDRFAQTRRLAPADAELVAFRAADRPTTAEAPVAAAAELLVRDVRPAADAAPAGPLTVTATFANEGGAGSDEFVPLLVLAAADGRELGESYGAPVRLAPGQSLQVPLQLKRDGVAPGHYFVSVIPSHPKTGKPLGRGRYHVPVELAQ